MYGYTTHIVKMWFGIVEPPRTHVIDLYTPCFLCTEVVRGGSLRLNHPEQVYRYHTHLDPLVKNQRQVLLSPERFNTLSFLCPFAYFCENVLAAGVMSRKHIHAKIMIREPWNCPNLYCVSRKYYIQELLI